MSRVEKCLVPGPDGLIELVMEAGERLEQSHPLVAVIAHPHPLYGGSMDNKVVTTLSRLYRQLGVDVLRFNFRGIGSSEGVHDEGRGEVDDMLAVVKYARQQKPEARIILAGFSFGSAIAAAASEVLSSENLACQHLLLVAPPVDRYQYAPSGAFTCPTCIVIGGLDDIVDANTVADWVSAMAAPPRLVCIPEASHFFHGELVTLKTKLETEILEMMTEFPGSEVNRE